MQLGGRRLGWLGSCGVLVVVFVAASRAQVPQGSFFDSNGVQIHYVDQGEGEPVVLIPGFSGSLDNWFSFGQAPALLDAGFRVIALDKRGHGRSGKPHDPAQYGLEMVHDVVRLMDHVGVEKAHAVGYSMGGLIALKTVADQPERLLTATVGGAGWFGAGPGGPLWDYENAGEATADGSLGVILRAMTPLGDPEPTADDIAVASQASFARNDQMALASALRGFPPVIQVRANQLASNTVPTLVVVGERDPLIGDAKALMPVMANLEFVELPGSTHTSAPVDELFLRSVIAFLSKHREGR